jgi:hypothetical protein
VEPGAPTRGWLQVVPALVVGVAVVVATSIAMAGVRYVKTFNTSLLRVSGEAQQVVTSDEVKWTAGFFVNAQASALQGAYARMDADKAAVLRFLEGNGVKASEITVSPVNMMQNFVDCKVNPKACGPFGPTTYRLDQTVSVDSGDVQKITALAQDTGRLVGQGVLFSTRSLQYFYTKLPDLREKLLAQATKEAQARAEKIAAATGDRVGQLVSVTTEPLQLTPVNSVQVSNSGIYDTTTIRKKLTAIVQATFRLPQ